MVVNVPTSWLARPGSDHHILFEWLDRYVAAGYHPVGLIDIFSDGADRVQMGRRGGRRPAAFAIIVFGYSGEKGTGTVSYERVGTGTQLVLVVIRKLAVQELAA